MRREHFSQSAQSLLETWQAAQQSLCSHVDTACESLTSLPLLQEASLGGDRALVLRELELLSASLQGVAQEVSPHTASSPVAQTLSAVSSLSSGQHCQQWPGAGRSSLATSSPRLRYACSSPRSSARLRRALVPPLCCLCELTGSPGPVSHAQSREPAQGESARRTASSSDSILSLGDTARPTHAARLR